MPKFIINAFIQLNYFITKRNSVTIRNSTPKKLSHSVTMTTNSLKPHKSTENFFVALSL